MSVQRIVPQPGDGQGLVQDDIRVEDVMAYVRFVTERAGLSDQDALTVALGKLTDRMDAVSIGSLYRTHQHIRDVARRMLLSRKEPPNEQGMATIVESLAERVYAHGHAIGLTDAQEIGLPVSVASDDEEKAMWLLLNEYEADLSLLRPVDPAAAIEQSDPYKEEGVIAVIESSWASLEFTGQLDIRAQRQMPPNFNVALNIALQLPPNINAQQLPAALQQALQQTQQQLALMAQQAIEEALKKQAPITGIQASFRNGRWEVVI